MAEQMLGEGSLAVPTRTRGIYCRFPQRDIPVQPLKPHTDGHEFHLGVLGFIDDVPANGGGFTIWPKSHRVFYYQHLTQYGGDKADTYDEYYDLLKEQKATECCGEAGDIVFFHHRLAHAGNPPNYSLEIRKAIIGDLVKKDLKDKLEWNRPARTCGETGTGFRTINDERTMRSVAISVLYTPPDFAHKIDHALVPQTVSLRIPQSKTRLCTFVGWDLRIS